MNLVQDLAREELSADPAPPRDVVTAALHDGRRARRRRRLAGVGSGLVLAVAAFVATPAMMDRYGPPAGAPSSTVVIEPVPTSGPKIQATPGSVLEALLYLLPPGERGAYHGSFDDTMIIVMTDLTTALGTGQVTVNITHHRPGSYEQTDTSGRCEGDHATSCHYLNLDNGTKVTVLHLAGDCDSTTTVTAMRPNDTSVTVFVPTCIRSQMPAPQMLTVDEAVAIAVNPALDWAMASSLVDAGSQHFPDLPGAPS